MIEKLPFFVKALVKNKVKNSLGGRLRVFIVGAAPVNPEIADTLEKIRTKFITGVWTNRMCSTCCRKYRFL